MIRSLAARSTTRLVTLDVQKIRHYGAMPVRGLVFSPSSSNSNSRIIDALATCALIKVASGGCSLDPTRWLAHFMNPHACWVQRAVGDELTI